MTLALLLSGSAMTLGAQSDRPLEPGELVRLQHRTGGRVEWPVGNLSRVTPDSVIIQQRRRGEPESLLSLPRHQVLRIERPGAKKRSVGRGAGLGLLIGGGGGAAVGCLAGGKEYCGLGVILFGGGGAIGGLVVGAIVGALHRHESWQRATLPTQLGAVPIGAGVGAEFDEWNYALEAVGEARD